MGRPRKIRKMTFENLNNELDRLSDMLNLPVDFGETTGQKTTQSHQQVESVMARFDEMKDRINHKEQASAQQGIAAIVGPLLKSVNGDVTKLQSLLKTAMTDSPGVDKSPETVPETDEESVPVKAVIKG